MKNKNTTDRLHKVAQKGESGTVSRGTATCPELAIQLDAVSGIRRGLAQALRGQGRLADEVFDELEHDARSGK